MTFKDFKDNFAHLPDDTEIVFIFKGKEPDISFFESEIEGKAVIGISDH